MNKTLQAEIAVIEHLKRIDALTELYCGPSETERRNYEAAAQFAALDGEENEPRNS